MKYVISRKKWTLAKSCIPYLPIYLWNYPRWQPCRSKRSSSRSLVIPKHDFWPCNPSWTSWWPLRVSCTFLRWRDKCQVSFGGTTAEFRWYPSLLRKTLCLILLIGKICEWNDNPIHLNVLWMFDFYVELGSINSFRKLVHFCRLILASHDKINLEWEQLYWLQVHCMCTF